MEIDTLYEKILKEYSSGVYRDEIIDAKLEYYRLSGLVHEDNTLYNERIHSFLDWYIFDRDLNDEDISPVKLFFSKYKEYLNENELSVLNNFLNSIHSLFLLIRISKKFLYVKDLFSSKKYMVMDLNLANFIKKGDIFEGRLIPYKGRYVFLKGFCFHPPDTRNFIINEIKKVKNLEYEQRISLIMRLAMMRVKVEEYPHVEISRIYSKNPKVVF
jgi:hypothetical protein